MHDRLLIASFRPREDIHPRYRQREQDRGDHRQGDCEGEIELTNSHSSRLPRADSRRSRTT